MPERSFFRIRVKRISKRCRYTQNMVLNRKMGFTADKCCVHFKFLWHKIMMEGIDDNDRTFFGSPHPYLWFQFKPLLQNFDLGIFLRAYLNQNFLAYWRAFTVWPGAFRWAVGMERNKHGCCFTCLDKCKKSDVNHILFYIWKWFLFKGIKAMQLRCHFLQG